jgi:outer membrane protein TolC
MERKQTMASEKTRILQLVFAGFFLIWFTVSLSMAKAEEKDKKSPTLQLKELIKTALENNPGLHAAKKRWQRSIERLPQVNSYPDPMLKYTYFLENVETRVGPQKQIFGISQKFPFPGKLSLKGDMVAKDAEIAYLGYETAILKLIARVKTNYYELWYIHQALALTKKNMDLMEHLVKITETDLSVDGTTLTDIFKAQQQLAQLQYDLILLREQEETVKTQINTLLDLPPETKAGVPGKLSFDSFEYDPDTLYSMAEQYSQRLKMVQQEIEKSDHAISLAKREYWPDLTAGFTYIEIDDADPVMMNNRLTEVDDSGKDAYTINFAVNIPIQLGRRNAGLREAKLRQGEAKLNKKDIKNELFADIKSLYFRIRNSERLIKLYQDSLIPQAEQSIQTTEAWYREKRGSLSGMLETRAVWLNFNLAHRRALADYNQRVAKMEPLVGKVLTLQDLERGDTNHEK